MTPPHTIVWVWSTVTTVVQQTILIARNELDATAIQVHRGRLDDGYWSMLTPAHAAGGGTETGDEGAGSRMIVGGLDLGLVRGRGFRVSRGGAGPIRLP